MGATTSRYITQVRERADQATIRAATLIQAANRVSGDNLTSMDLATLSLMEAQAQATLALAAEIKLLRLTKGVGHE